jgi:hypothetical protein
MFWEATSAAAGGVVAVAFAAAAAAAAQQQDHWAKGQHIAQYCWRQCQHLYLLQALPAHGVQHLQDHLLTWQELVCWARQPRMLVEPANAICCWMDYETSMPAWPA